MRTASLLDVLDIDIDAVLEDVPVDDYYRCIDDLLKQCRSREAPTVIAVVCHRKADADALASLATTKTLLESLAEQHGVALDVPLVTPEGVPNRQNTAILTVTGLKEQTTLNLPDHYDAVILVDATSTEQGNVRLPDVTPLVAIDPGHEGEPQEGTLFIGGNARATCTISTLLYIKKLLDSGEDMSLLDIRLPPELAALIHFGVVQDTNDCSVAETTDLDRWLRMWSYIQVDNGHYQRIENYPRPRSEYLLLQHALNTTYERGSLVVSSLGSITPDDVDEVSRIADFLRAREGIQKVATLGIVTQEDHKPLIKASVRTQIDTTDTVANVRQLLGPTSGGNQGMAAGTATLGYRGELLLMTREDNSDESVVGEDLLPDLFLRLMRRWQSEDNTVPEPFHRLQEALKMVAEEFGYNEEEEARSVTRWFLERRKEWARERQEQEQSPFPNEAEQLAELFREAKDLENNCTGTPQEVLEQLIFYQHVRRARATFGEEK